jgi:hypothetical protein
MGNISHSHGFPINFNLNIIDKSQIYYLSIPYSFNPNFSYSLCETIVNWLMKNKVHVYSPILHSHFLEDISYDFFLENDLKLLSRFDGLIVTQICGYKKFSAKYLLENSNGVKTEYLFAKALDIDTYQLQIYC